MLIVRQSTAFETAIGPILDADGVAVTDSVVGDLKIKKTSGNFGALNGSATLTHVSAGVYDLVLTTADVDTVGVACIAADDTVNACAPLYLQVIEEAVYDAFYAASAPGYVANAPVNLVQSLGAAIFDSDFTIASATATTVTLPSTYADSTSLPDDDRYVYTVLSVVDGTGQGELVLLTTAAAGAREYNVLSGSMPVQLDNTSKCVVVGKWQANTIHVNGTVQTAGDLAALVTTVDGVVDTILVDTNELQTDWANGGRLDVLIDGIKAKTDGMVFTVTGYLDCNVLKFRNVDPPASPFPA